MAGKTISSGTLGLRFMQNAQRAKQQQAAAAEAVAAPVADDAAWAVPQAVRDAWGAAPAARRAEATVTHEASYVPFVFGADDGGDRGEEEGAGTSARPALVGRRTFNECGQEVLRSEVRESAHEQEPAADATAGHSNALSSMGKGRPASISGFKAPLPAKARDGKKARTKTAQELIRETPAATAPPPSAAQHALAGFMRPADVDAPLPAHARAGQTKRQHDGAAEPAESRGKKRKKKADAGLATVE